MAQPSRDDRILAQRTQHDENAFQPGNSDPLTEAEIDDIIYGAGDPHARLARLMDLRGELLGRQSAEFSDEDAQELLADVDRAIARLNGSRGGAPEDLGDFEGEPGDHRETLSPDSDEFLDLEARDRRDAAERTEGLPKERH